LTWRSLCISSELKDVLSTIIHSSTLKTLDLTRINVPITLFQGIHLTKLVMNCVLLQFNLDDGERSKLQTPPDSDEEKASHTVIDQIVWKSDKPVHGTGLLTLFLFLINLRYRSP